MLVRKLGALLRSLLLTDGCFLTFAMHLPTGQRVFAAFGS
jgi:hypothetical protein